MSGVGEARLVHATLVCPSVFDFVFVSCWFLVTNYGGLHDSDQNLDLNASLHADYIINHFYIIIRLYL